MKKVVFIVGTGHCGSTLLDLILSTHPDAFGLGEISALKGHRHLYDNGNPFCNIHGDKDTFWNPHLKNTLMRLIRPRKGLRIILNKILPTADNRIEIKSRKKAYDLLFRITKKSILIDSSKNPKWIKTSVQAIHQLKDVTPYVIYLSRDGRAVITAYKRKYPGLTIEAIAKRWVAKIKKINNLLDNYNGNKYWLKYEDLASYPEKSIRDVCTFISINYSPEMIKFWEKTHHHIGGNRGTHSLITKFKYDKLITTDTNKKDYYGDHKLGIKLDERWKKELPTEQMYVIEEIINSLNKDIAQIDRF